MISGDSGKLVYFESHLKYQITTSQITLTRKNKKTNWGVNVSNIIAKVRENCGAFVCVVEFLCALWSFCVLSGISMKLI